MYTGLEHERIKKNVQEAIREAKEYAAELFSRDTRNNYRIDYDLNDTSKLMEHVNFIVDNTYFYTKTGILKQQKIGLPMGTNSAPEIANLTCYVDERDFIDGLITSGQTDEAKEHADIFDSLMMFLVGALSRLAHSTMVLNGKKPPLLMVQ